MIDLGRICKGIILVQSLLGESDCGMNGGIKVCVIEHAGGEDLIDVVHGWDNHGKIWHTTREEQSCILEDLEFD